jgi:peptidoglycan hydrolase-like protein with peptidoglycan-binding domain
MNRIQEVMFVPDTAVTPGPDLYPWDVKPAVLELQELLLAHGFKVPLNSDFDWKTEAAVKSYQRQHGLRVDGVVGQETWAALKSTVKPGARILRQGASGADVYELQGLLQVQGYGIKRDGVFAAETNSAVMSFQSQHHLLPDGIVRPVMWALLAGKNDILRKRKR